MSLASGTAPTSELRTLYEAVYKLETMLHPYHSGSATGTAIGIDGRFTKAQIDTQITAVSDAIAAVNL